jgi:hypothetical protein
LLIDPDGDHICDAIDTEADGLRFLQLNPVDPGGTSWYGNQTDGTAPSTAGVCDTTQATPARSWMCGGVSDLFRVIKHDIDMSPPEPAVYAPGEHEDEECTGAEWVMPGSGDIPEGWICLAATAKDIAGNTGVSRPLRLCYDDGVGAAPDCSPESAPTCLPATCTLPAPAFAGGILAP